MQPKITIESANQERITNADANPALTRIQLWDLPIRIFHWSLAIAVITAFVTAWIGGSLMEAHGKAGLAIVGLVVFRLVWGFIGSTHARFVNFAPSPSRLREYLQGRWRGVGHNPLGAFSIFALLSLLLLQTATGLFANDDIDFTGPLYALVEETLSDRLTGIHHLLSNFLLGLVALHVLAIIFYVRVKKDDLVKPMLTGWKEVRSDAESSKGRLGALVAALLIALAVVYGVSGAGMSETPPVNNAPGW